MSTGATFPSDGDIPFTVLKAITEDFKSEIGKPGVLGSVYKGKTEDGRQVAVKRHHWANGIGRRDKEEYCAQVRSIMKHKHDNIVELLGFCHHNNKITRRDGGFRTQENVVETLLCYDYYPNGNLHSHLFGDTASNLDWDTRFNIIIGICRGLWSLHTADKPIIHLNLKPQNIVLLVLDDHMVPKITDFVYSRILGENETRENTKSVVGSLGYKAPEYLSQGNWPVSAWADIYALGLMILEISTTEKNNPSEKAPSARDYIERLEKSWNENCKASIMSSSWYPGLDDERRQQVHLCIEIGFECVKLIPKERPDIETIVEKLNAC